MIPKNQKSAYSYSDDLAVLSETDLEISVVVPVYNSAATLHRLFDRLYATLSRTKKSFEILFVDDGSEDSSWAVLQEIHNAHPVNVTAIQLMRNFGQHNALMCAFRNARGKFVITLDDDLQNPPEEIPKLLDAISNSISDVVYGVYNQKQHSIWRNVGSTLLLAFYKFVFNSSITPTSFRILRRPVMNSILSYTLNFTYVDGLLAWNTQRIATVSVNHNPRERGSSGYNIGKLILLALNLFTNFTLLPLQIVSILGFLIAVSGFSLGGYFLVQFLLSNIAVPGFASVIIAILVLGGAQMMALGILGEYLGRLHLNVNQKPQYQERKVLINKTKTY